MLRFIGNWLSDTLRFGLGLMLALAALQVPALTHAYTNALLQVADGTRRDIDQREQIAREYYRWPDVAGDAAVVEALRAVEPANAEGLSASIAREQRLRQVHGELMAMLELLRPLSAGWQLLTRASAEEHAVLRTAMDTHVPQVIISTAGAIYGLAGLMIGLLLAQILLTLLQAMFGRRGRVAHRPVERRHPTLRA